MKKLDISQIVAVADKLSNVEWLSVLIHLNNTDQVQKFFEMIRQTRLLEKALHESKKTNIR